MAMNQDDILKLKAVALYILKKCGETDFIHLFKILYFAERYHYASYGKHLVKDTFYALERGPVPSFLYDSVKVATCTMVVDKSNPLLQIAQSIQPGEAECYFQIRAKEEPDMDELSPAEIKTLDYIIEENRFKHPDQLSKESHDIAWETAWNKKHSSPMNPSLIAQAGGAEDGFIRYMEEQEELDKYLME